jgi:ABC-type uncharacterized transport system substrate-binding protein
MMKTRFWRFTMRRLLFIGMIIAVFCGILEARPYRLCLAYFSGTPDIEACTRGITDGLAAQGLHEPSDYSLSQINVQGDPNSLPALANAVEQGNFDLVFTLSAPALRAVSDRIPDTPIVATYLADPTAAGVATSYNDHRPNVTGVLTIADFPRMMKTIHLLIPGVKSIGTLYTISDANSLLFLDLLRRAGKEASIIVEALPVTGIDDIARRAGMLSERKIDAVCQITDNAGLVALPGIQHASTRRNIPLFTFTEPAVKDTLAVAAVVCDYHHAGIQAAELALRILHGEDPARIPFATLDRSYLCLNVKNANRFKLQIPDELRKSADVIYPRP